MAHMAEPVGRTVRTAVANPRQPAGSLGSRTLLPVTSGALPANPPDRAPGHPCLTLARHVSRLNARSAADGPDARAHIAVRLVTHGPVPAPAVRGPSQRRHTIDNTPLLRAHHLGQAHRTYRSDSFPWRPELDASSLECLSHRLGVAAVMASSRYLSDLRRHRRPVQAPARRQLLHAGARLVLGNQPLRLLGRQSALRLPLSGRHALPAVR